MFAVLPTPHRTILPTQKISETQYACTFSASPAFTNLVIFILPENELPANALAGIYLHLPSMQPNEFKLLGALGPVIDANGNLTAGPEGVKLSAIFKVAGISGSTGASGDMDMDAVNAAGEVTVGISLEPINVLGPQILALTAAKPPVTSTALTVVAPNAGAASAPSAKVLAQKIIQNAFNFLASFTGGPGQDVVPLKAFEEWWKKFERRVEVDPGFLERDV